MRHRIIGSVFLLGSVLAVTSCKKTVKASESETETKVNNEPSVSEVLSQYEHKTKMTVTETTEGVTKSGENVSAVRTTDVDAEKDYFSSVLKCGNDTGFVKKIDSCYYYSLGSAGGKLDYGYASSFYEVLGIDGIFDQTYKEKNGTGTVFLTDFGVTSGFENVYKNINADLETEYNYNSSSFLTITVNVKEEKLASVVIDLSYPFSSYFSALTRTYVFSEEDFEYQDLDLSSGTKYYCNTGTTLDTYMIEMVYQYGDAIYIKSGDFDMLVDAGQNQDGPNVDKILSEYCTDHKLECLVATHGHGDHIGGFGNGALNSITDVDLIIDYGYTDNDRYYEDYRTYYGSDWYAAYDCVNLINGASKIFRFSDALSIEILDTGQYAERGKPLHSDCSDENEHSVVFKLTYGTNTYLYTGDISQNYEEPLEQEDIKDITVYKVAHHGAQSNKTNSASFINYINPAIAIVSAGIIDQYSYATQLHPTKAAISRLLNAPRLKESHNIYYNGTMGTIHLSDNGSDLPSVTGLGAERGYYYNNELVTGEENKKFTDTVFYQTR